MQIPAVFAVEMGEDAIGAVSVPEDRCLPETGDRVIPFADAAASVPRGETREPAVVVDWDSIRARGFREAVLKGMRLRGRDIWFLAWVQDADDLMDAFNTTAESVLFPYHAVASDDDLLDILSMSDSAIPTVFVRNGKVVNRSIAPADLRETVGRLDDLGFHRACILDTDGSVTAYEWERILDLHPLSIPFVTDASAVEGYCAGRLIAPLRLRPHLL